MMGIQIKIGRWGMVQPLRTNDFRFLETPDNENTVTEKTPQVHLSKHWGWKLCLPPVSIALLLVEINIEVRRSGNGLYLTWKIEIKEGPTYRKSVIWELSWVQAELWNIFITHLTDKHPEKGNWSRDNWGTVPLSSV